MVKKAKRERKEQHKHSLADELLDPATHGVRVAPRTEKRRRRLDEDAEADMPEELAAKVMKAAEEQRRELAEERLRSQGPASTSADATDLIGTALRRASRKPVPVKSEDGAWDEWEEEEVEDEDALWRELQGDEEEVTAEDQKALEAFMAPGGGGMRSLADVILSKIREQQEGAGLETVPERAEDYVPRELDPKVVEVYRGVGEIMSRYTTGKVPKAFKVIPALQNWEEVLYLTSPERWSPHAVFVATRLFASNLNAKMAQRFYSLVLLPRFRTEILDNKKIHFATFMALKKAFYKPAAMYKGVLLPLCQSRTCTLREAVILSAVIRRVHVPALHSGAALLRLAEMEYGGTTSFFIRVLLDKKYALPYRVIDAMVEHFVRFAKEERHLPVVWHQSLLTFVQRYKTEIRSEDKERLRKLGRVQYHYQITPEVVRELNNSLARGQAPIGGGGGHSKVGVHVVENVANLPPVLVKEEA